MFYLVWVATFIVAVGLVLLVKALVLAIFWYCFFSAPLKPADSGMTSHFVGAKIDA